MADQNRKPFDQEYSDQSQNVQDSTERERTSRERPSVADDRTPGSDSFSEDREADELGSEHTNDGSSDDLDDDDSDGSGRSNR